MDDYTRHLFSYLPPSRLTTWSCGHIIPSSNLIALPLAQGPSAIPFDFTYSNRASRTLLTALGNTFITLATCIPDGIVIFFPSYAYLDLVTQHLKTTNIWPRLQALKPIFLESKSSTTDTLLADYSLSISTNRGGILLSVIGGKLSEGINFSDALGRGVIVVGLPFPNIHSAQWKAKLEYVEQATVKKGGSREEGKASAREFYENACMRAVNQCIGRAIRHKGDYAAIVLLDGRYGTSRIEGKLPGWIKEGVVRGEGCRGVEGKLRGFFEGKGR